MIDMAFYEVNFGNAKFKRYYSIVKARKDIIKSGKATYGRMRIYDYSKDIGYVYFDDSKGYCYHSIIDKMDYRLRKDGKVGDRIR